MFRDYILAHARQIGEIAGQRIGLCPHFRHDGTERDGGTHRLQCVFRLDQKRGRRLPPDTLEGCQNLNDDVAAICERFLKQMFLIVEWQETRPGRLDTGFDVADTCGGVDQLLVELGSILTQRLDFAPELGLAVCRIALLGAHRIEFLILLLERVRAGRRRRCRWRRSNGGRRRKIRDRSLGDGRLRQRRLIDVRLARLRLSESTAARSKRERQCQCRSEHKARISSARPSENHRVQG
jgi:hypothetical protein